MQMSPHFSLGQGQAELAEWFLFPSFFIFSSLHSFPPFPLLLPSSYYNFQSPPRRLLSALPSPACSLSFLSHTTLSCLYLSCSLFPFLCPLPLSVLFPRNLSSADAGRQTMRNYSGLIDSLMAYVQNCVAASRCDDKVSASPGGTLTPRPRPLRFLGAFEAWPSDKTVAQSQGW